ncbi:MAG TPA: hypothetical protein VLW26_07920 [Steroidobacteraceae bacterium]|nr:hypothetical protein [Steroidobacteraceae bacterium]
MLAQPEPGLTPARLIERAVALRPLLREQQAENDRRGHYSEAIQRQLLAGGFYRILQPRRFGGYEFPLETFIRVIAEIARGHPASGWCFALAASHGYVLASHWSEAGQIELFGPQGDFRSAMTAGPAGTFRRTDGGYIVSGVHPFASGIPVCTHFMGAGLTRDAPGPPRPIYFVVPKQNYTILPDWGGELAMGMQGSGSNSVKISEAFVPDQHIISAARVMTEQLDPKLGTIGTQLHGNPMYLGVLMGWFSCEFGAILSGTARAAIDEFEDMLRTRKLTFNPQLERMYDPTNQILLGEALSRTQAAEALTLSAVRLYAEQCERWGRQGIPVSARDTFEVWSISREACRAACEAVEMLFRGAGASISKSGQPLQRYFRDVQMYRVHLQSQPLFAQLRGLVQLGLPLPPPFGN